MYCTASGRHYILSTLVNKTLIKLVDISFGWVGSNTRHGITILDILVIYLGFLDDASPWKYIIRYEQDLSLIANDMLVIRQISRPQTSERKLYYPELSHKDVIDLHQHHGLLSIALYIALKAQSTHSSALSS